MTLEEQLKETINNIGRRWDELKAENDKHIGKAVKDALADAKLSNLGQAIDDLTAKRADLERRMALAERVEARVTDLEQQLKTERGNREDVERKLNALRIAGSADPAARKLELRQKVNVWARGVVNAYTIGVPNLNAEQQKALSDTAAEYKSLSVADDTTGGYLAPLEYVREIIKGVTEISPMRSLVRVRTTAQKGIQIPKRTGRFAARRAAEQGPRTETDGLRYGMHEINAPEMYAIVDVSTQNLEDSAFDLESEIRLEAEEQFAVREGQEMITGSGVDECEGILSNTDVAYTPSGTAATIADTNGVADGLITLFHAIPTAYSRNGRWLLNRTTLGDVRKLKDTNKQYIWQPGLALGKPDTILNAPYTEVPDMPNAGANAHPIAFGDFQRAYILLDRIGMSMLRDPYTQAAGGTIRFLFRRRVGGRVVLAEAIRKLRCSAN